VTSRPLLLSLLLGAAAACGFEPLALWPLTLACLAAWMLLVHRAPTIRAALWRGWAFGVGHFTINDNWFQHAFDFQDKMPPVLGYAAPLLLALYLAVYPAMAAGVAWRLRGPKSDAVPDAGYALAFGAVWIATEWLRATVFTGYAWDPIAVIWVPVQPVASTAAWFGTYALSGLSIVLAGAILLLFLRRRWTAALPLVALLALQPLSYRGADRPVAPNTPRVVVVQPNVGLDKTGQPDMAALYTALARQSGEPGTAPRLILWPEGALRDPVESGYPSWVYGVDPAELRARLAELLGPQDVLMTGGEGLYFDRAGKMTAAANSVYAIDAKGRIAGRYDKAHLVPYGEYLPMPWLLRPLGLDRLVPGAMDFLPGPGPRAITVPVFGAVGVQVCYEIVFSGEVIDRAHRPRLLFNPSTDAWFGKWGPPQHLAQARMRAIEEGLPVLRSTPTGISAVIAADGRLIGAVPHETEGRIDVPLPEAAPPTLFSRLGNLAAAVVAVLLAAAAIVIRRRAR
jgi:apolipoprotein N-acyltransferase